MLWSHLGARCSTFRAVRGTLARHGTDLRQVFSPAEIDAATAWNPEVIVLDARIGTACDEARFPAAGRGDDLAKPLNREHLLVALKRAVAGPPV